MGSDLPPLDRWFARVFGDGQSRQVGSGWISGVLSVFLGSVALGSVLVFRFPGLLTSAEFRSLYPVTLLRGVLQAVIVAGFLLGAISVVLRRRKVLGLTGLALVLLASLLGGANVPIESQFDRRVTIGLDWFLLNAFVFALVFVPLERAFPRLRDQTTFRFGWTTDGMHFLVSHLAVQVVTLLTLLPSSSLARWWQPDRLRGAIRGQPLWLQFIEIVLIADLTQYWLHRAFHRVPLLWRFHAVHHSSRALDWIAGSRLHVVDVVVTRGLLLVPIFLLGFAERSLYAYVAFVSFHAVFIHANVRFRFGWLDHVVATPRAHHWHHAVKPVDVNFAVHLPILDRIFGTQHLPGDEWPDGYGIDGNPVPEGWWPQLVWPFRGSATEVAEVRRDGDGCSVQMSMPKNLHANDSRHR